MPTRRLALGLVAVVSTGLLACVLLAEEPKEERRTDEKTEEFEYKVDGQTKKGTRRVLTLDLGGVTMELVRIKGGTFQMGSPDSDKDARDNEKPQHGVTIRKDFYLSKYLVTQQQYNALLGENPSYYSPSGDGMDKVPGLDTGRFPVEEVSWDDAQLYCKRLSERTSRQAGLPTEAEWEYAFRAGTTTRYPCGDELTPSDANFNGKLRRTCVVGSYPANPFGLYDMMGNAWEWCSDYYDPKYYTISPKEDPENLEKSAARVARGGSYDYGSRLCRPAYRSFHPPANRYNDIGFRVRVRLD